jgi:hypothetical protein
VYSGVSRFSFRLPDTNSVKAPLCAAERWLQQCWGLLQLHELSQGVRRRLVLLGDLQPLGARRDVGNGGCNLRGQCASLALAPAPLIFPYKPEKSLCGTGAPFTQEVVNAGQCERYSPTVHYATAYCDSHGSVCRPPSPNGEFPRSTCINATEVSQPFLRCIDFLDETRQFAKTGAGHMIVQDLSNKTLVLHPAPRWRQ